MLRSETGRTLGAFIFEEILCRWGAVEGVVTDNRTADIAALDWLANKYRIWDIASQPTIHRPTDSSNASSTPSASRL